MDRLPRLVLRCVYNSSERSGPSVSIQGREFQRQLSNYELLKTKNSLLQAVSITKLHISVELVSIYRNISDTKRLKSLCSNYNLFFRDC